MLKYVQKTQPRKSRFLLSLVALHNYTYSGLVRRFGFILKVTGIAGSQFTAMSSLVDKHVVYLK